MVENGIKTILVIDDELEFTEIIKNNLERSGEYKVLVALNGKDGIRLAQKYKPDMILLDVIMPKMDGFEVLKTIKCAEETVAIPVVMLSARTDSDAKLKAMSLYNEDYITKPVDLEELRQRIKLIFNRKQG